jgi:hypothetical protein
MASWESLPAGIFPVVDANMAFLMKIIFSSYGKLLLHTST